MSSVVDSAQSIAQNTDIVATMDMIDIYNNLVANSNTDVMTDADRQQIRETTSAIADMRPDLIAARVNPAAATVTVAGLSALRSRIQATIVKVRQQPRIEGFASAGISTVTSEKLATAAPATATTPATATAPNTITVAELMNLVSRIKAASTAITSLGTTDATLTQRKVTLDRMSADLIDMITKVNKGDLELSKVPITPAAATAFLSTVDNNSKPLSTLYTASSSDSTTNTTNTTDTTNTTNTTAALQTLLPSVQDALSGIKFRISYDPAFAQRADIMKRLQALEDKLFLYASTSTPIPPATMELLKQELTVLGAVAGIRPSPSRHCLTKSLPTTSTRMTGDDRNSSAEYPSLSQLSSASGQGFMLGGVANKGLTDDQIAKRGSMASFDPTTVGGLDYKARSVEMCRQLKVEYGDNATFGCVRDPESVNPDYSWKGNYTSVCNRIGDAWGGRAGEKYGCPPINPAAKFSHT